VESDARRHFPLHIHLLGGFQLVSGEAQLITQELEAG
jgi:hypothetical protein